VVAQSHPQSGHAAPAAAAPAAAAPRRHADPAPEVWGGAIAAPPPARVRAPAADVDDAPMVVGAAPQVSSGTPAAPEEDTAAETGIVTEPAAPGMIPEATPTPEAETPQPPTATPTPQPSPTPTEPVP